nr:hypothetical transcript [Hymenolepis microstoma]
MAESRNFMCTQTFLNGRRAIDPIATKCGRAVDRVKEHVRIPSVSSEVEEKVKSGEFCESGRIWHAVWSW